MVRSLEQFQLGDGGGPAYLIAWDRERFLSESEGTRATGESVVRRGTRTFPPSWGCRRSFRRPLHRRPLEFHGILPVAQVDRRPFELTVLLLTEIVSTVYYRLLHRHGKDTALRAMCRLIIRDEVGHVAFHRDRLARAARAGNANRGKWWELCFRMLGLARGHHAVDQPRSRLAALGATTAEFYREVWLEEDSSHQGSSGGGFSSLFVFRTGR